MYATPLRRLLALGIHGVAGVYTLKTVRIEAAGITHLSEATCARG